MKANIVTGDTFPATLTITIENEAELRELWHRFNISNSMIPSAYTHPMDLEFLKEVPLPKDSQSACVCEVLEDFRMDCTAERRR
jgi:hypothetical protein